MSVQDTGDSGDSPQTLPIVRSHASAVGQQTGVGFDPKVMRRDPVLRVKSLEVDLHVQALIIAETTAPETLHSKERWKEVEMVSESNMKRKNKQREQNQQGTRTTSNKNEIKNKINEQ